MKLISFCTILCLVMVGCSHNPAKPDLPLPVVDAGVDTTISVLDTIVLNSSFSGDSITAFSWAIGDSSFDTSFVRFTAPESACIIIAVFRAENEAGSVADSVIITVTSDTIVLASTVTYSDDSVPAFFSQYVYDSAGDQVRQTRYKPDSTVSGWTVFVFEGNILLLRINRKPDSSVTVRESLFYNNDGNNIRVEFRSGTGALLGFDNIVLDGTERSLTSYHFGPDSTLWYSYAFSYNSDGQLIRKTYHSAAGTPGGYTEFTYNLKGRLLSENSYSANGIITGFVRYSYDALHKLRQ